MSKIGQIDGAIIGGVAGLLIAYPSIATTIHNFVVDKIIPSTWDFFGSITAPLLIIGGFILIGFLVDKTR